jgi:hypothetical protein
MDLPALFDRIEETLLAQFREAGFVQHPGDRGANREEILRRFLGERLPRRYGVTNGEIITKKGAHSHSADIIVYDAEYCPVVYANETKVIPIEGVYGIIEVKSALSKQEFIDAARKIAAFKDLAPRDLSVIRTREYVTVHRPSRPFGIVLGFTLADNSLESLQANYEELNKEIYWVNNFANFVAVLGAGILRLEKIDFSTGDKQPLLDTDELVNLVETQQKRARTGEPQLDIMFRMVREELGGRSFGRFYVYLLILLEAMRLGVPDLALYVDPTLPPTIRRES